jgi:hypothetical protein
MRCSNLWVFKTVKIPFAFFFLLRFQYFIGVISSCYTVLALLKIQDAKLE